MYVFISQHETAHKTSCQKDSKAKVLTAARNKKCLDNIGINLQYIDIHVKSLTHTVAIWVSGVPYAMPYKAFCTRPG